MARMTFEDQSVRSGFGDRPNTYKAEAGRRDRIRILTMPGLYASVPLTVLKEDEKTGLRKEVFFAVPSLVNPTDPGNEDLLYDALVSNDKQSLEKCREICPYFRKGFKVRPRFPVLIHHISSSSTGKRDRKEDKFLVWDIPSTVYSLIRDLIASLPKSKKTGKPVDIRLVELDVSCTDTQFQKININTITSASALSYTFAESMEMARESGQFVDDAPEKDSQLEPYHVVDLLAVIRPDSEQDAMDTIARAMTKVSKSFVDDTDDIDLADEDLENDPEPVSRSSKTSRVGSAGKKKNTKKKQIPDDDEDLAAEIEEAIGDLSDGLGGDDLEDDDIPF